MRNNTKLSKILIVTLCAVCALTLSMSVLTPAVEAASENPITETNQTEEQTTYTSEQEDVLALTRAKAVDEAKLEAESIVEELKVEAQEQKEKEAQEAEKSQATTSQSTSTQISNTTSSSSSTTNSSSNSGDTYVSGSSQSGYLMDIANPDPNYKSYSIHLSDSDRDLAERILMGEAGSMGYTGMAVVAQSLRDAYVMGGHSDIATVIKTYGYYGSTSIKPSQTCKDVVSYIFDQGGSAVQHRVIAFYSTQYCSSPWHESQEFVCQIGKVRFFDLW